MPFSAADLFLVLAPAIPLGVLGWCLRWLMRTASPPGEVHIPAPGREPVPQQA